MAKGILGIEAVAPIESTKPDITPATQEVKFSHPRHDAIAIVTQWESPVFDEEGKFVRIPVRVNDQITMGSWSQDGTFAKGPGEKRIYDDPDFLNPEMLAKYPNLESSLLYLLGVIQAEEIEKGII